MTLLGNWHVGLYKMGCLSHHGRVNFMSFLKRSVFFLLSWSVLLCASNATAQTLKVGITSKTLFFMPYYIGQKKGIYAAENIKIEPILIGRSDVQLAALLAGELHFGSLNADATIVINEKGGNLKVIAGVDNSSPYIFVGGKAYKKFDDLKGAKIGVSALRGGATSILLDYLKNKGLLYPRDFSMMVISGGTSARLTALESGAIAGTVLGIPYSDIAIDQGFTKLGDTLELISHISIQLRHNQSFLGGEKPFHRGQISQGSHTQHPLDL